MLEIGNAEIDDFEHIKIMATTWNMHGSCPGNDLFDELFQKDVVHHDIYVLGTQEA